MIRAEASVEIAAEPRAILEWVTDLERYRLADTKITKVLVAPDLDDAGRGRARYRGTMRGIPGPADWNDVELTRWTALRFTGSAGVWTRRLFDFEGSFTCESTETGTRVTHIEAFTFKGPGRLAERWLRPWLEQEVVAEMTRLQTQIEADQPRPVL